VHNNHVYAWRSTSGKLYCSEFAAGGSLINWPKTGTP